MPKATLYDINGTNKGEIELADSVFGIEPSVASVHTVVTAHLAARRQGTQSSLTRAEVSGGGIKPWRQKGTGRARQGSTRSPQWTHGGIVFAPKPRDYRFSVNKKIRKLAMRSALSSKAAQQNIYVIEDLNFDEIKTKNFVSFLTALGVQGKSYVVTPESRETVFRSARNIPTVRTTVSGAMNVYDIVNAQNLIIDKAAIAHIEEVFSK